MTTRLRSNEGLSGFILASIGFTLIWIMVYPLLGLGEYLVSASLIFFFLSSMLNTHLYTRSFEQSQPVWKGVAMGGVITVIGFLLFILLGVNDRNMDTALIIGAVAGGLAGGRLTEIKGK